MKILIYILIVMMMGNSEVKTDNCNIYSGNGINIDTLPLEDLSQGWNNMKNLNNRCTKAWGSDLQQVMIQLGKKLGQPGTERSEIVRLMGNPDYEAEKVEVLRMDADEKILLYFWRGWHDWLYFIIDKNGKVKYSDWWYAYE